MATNPAMRERTAMRGRNIVIQGGVLQERLTLTQAEAQALCFHHLIRKNILIYLTATLTISSLRTRPILLFLQHNHPR